MNPPPFIVSSKPFRVPFLHHELVFRRKENCQAFYLYSVEQGVFPDEEFRYYYLDTATEWKVIQYVAERLNRIEDIVLQDQQEMFK